MADTYVDEYLPGKIVGYDFTGTPRFSTSITAVASGSERRNRNWIHPLHKFTAPQGVRCNEDIFALHEMWMVLGGPECTFPFRDPMDFASRRLEAPNVEPQVAGGDQALGTGTGFQRDFQLYKRYTFGTRTYDRLIYRPIEDSVEVLINGLAPNDISLAGGPYTWDVDRLTGIVTFDPAPHIGLVLTAGFLFDVEVRFADDTTYESVVKAFRQSGFAALDLVEVRPC